MRASRLASEEQFSGYLAGIPSRNFGQEIAGEETMRRSKRTERLGLSALSSDLTSGTPVADMLVKVTSTRARTRHCRLRQVSV
jgi:hypothetical protein